MRRLIPLALCLAACDSPSPQMRGAQAMYFQAEGHAMTLWRHGNSVEVIRHGYAPRNVQQRLRPAMAQAMVDLTGCTIRDGTLDGDTGVLRAKLKCP